MIIFDEKTDEIFGGCRFEYQKATRNANIFGMGGSYTMPSTVYEILIEIPIDKYQYVKDWETQIYNQVTGMSNPSSEYKRTLYIFDKIDISLIGTWICEYEMTDETIIVKLSCDYSIEGPFPELKQIYRDRKIDELLS